MTEALERQYTPFVHRYELLDVRVTDSEGARRDLLVRAPSVFEPYLRRLDASSTLNFLSSAASEREAPGLRFRADFAQGVGKLEVEATHGEIDLASGMFTPTLLDFKTQFVGRNVEIQEIPCAVIVEYEGVVKIERYDEELDDPDELSQRLTALQQKYLKDPKVTRVMYGSVVVARVCVPYGELFKEAEITLPERIEFLNDEQDLSRRETLYLVSGQPVILSNRDRVRREKAKWN